MKMDLPLSVVVDMTFNAAQRLVECGPGSRKSAARIIQQFIGAAPKHQRGHLKANLKDAVAHARQCGRFK